MSPLILNTMRTPTEGLLASGFCASWSLPNTDYILRCFPVWLPWCWVRELCMKSCPQHSHSPGFGVLRGNLFGVRTFPHLIQLFFCVFIFSSMSFLKSDQSESGQKPFQLMIIFLGFLPCLSSHVKKLMKRTSSMQGLSMLVSHVSLSLKPELKISFLTINTFIQSCS